MAVLCISTASQEDTASYWLNKGNESLEEALNGSQNQTDRELILHRALQEYDEAIELDQQSSLAWYKKGEILIELARFDEVLPCLNKSLEINPQYADAWHHKGKILTAMGMYEEAVQA